MQGLSLVAASGGHSSSRCAGLSLSQPVLLRSTSSRRAGSVAVAHGLSCSAACGIFPDQGSNPCLLHWQADSQPLRHHESPYFIIFDQYLSIRNITFLLNSTIRKRQPQNNDRWQRALGKQQEMVHLDKLESKCPLVGNSQDSAPTGCAQPRAWISMLELFTFLKRPEFQFLKWKLLSETFWPVGFFLKTLQVKYIISPGWIWPKGPPMWNFGLPNKALLL